jgi:hypothetical protein
VLASSSSSRLAAFAFLHFLFFSFILLLVTRSRSALSRLHISNTGNSATFCFFGTRTRSCCQSSKNKTPCFVFSLLRREMYSGSFLPCSGRRRANGGSRAQLTTCSQRSISRMLTEAECVTLLAGRLLKSLQASTAAASCRTSFAASYHPATPVHVLNPSFPCMGKHRITKRTSCTRRSDQPLTPPGVRNTQVGNPRRACGLLRSPHPPHQRRLFPPQLSSC